MLKLTFYVLLVQLLIINKIKAEYLQVVSDFDSITRDVTTSTLIVEGNEWNVDSSSLSSDVFEPVENIDELLIINILTSLTTKIFSLPHLKEIKIENNQLQYIGPQIWFGLDIEKLSLRNNQIKKLHNHVFDGLKVSILDLSNNKLQELPNKCLQSLRLYKITLRNNKLTQINLDTFGPEIAYVDLSNNLLTSIDVEVFNGVYALLNLNLSGNKFTVIEAVPTLSRLQVLDYSNNDISVITGDAFVHYNDLRILHLDHNNLFRINYQSFSDVAPVRILTIDHNYLSGLSDELLNALENLSFLKFGGNPWSCQCLQPILDFIKKNNIGLDYCEAGLIKKKKEFCIEYFDTCTGNEPNKLSQNFDMYTTFIKNYKC